LLRQLPVAGWGLIVALTAVNAALGLLPVGFVIATSVLVGRAPAAVAGGLGSPQWDALVSVFLVASGLFFGQQLLSPVQLSLADMVKHRVDGHVHGRLMEVALRSTGIGPLEDQQTLDHLRQAAESLEHGFRTPVMRRRARWRTSRVTPAWPVSWW
jgi:ATP-binding cassette subfamily B protein